MKNFIRGIGVGILVTTLVFSIAYMLVENKVSDEEVIRRAKQLGMTEASQKVIAEKHEEEATPEAVTDGIAQEPPEQDMQTQEPGEEDAGLLDNVAAPTPTDGEMVSINIERGQDGITVSQILQQNGIIEDAADFNNYLYQNSLQRHIMYGTYDLKKNSSYEDIIKAIVRK